MKCRTLASLLAVLAGLTACSSAEKTHVPHEYTLVYLKTGPNSGKLSESDNEKAFAGHFSNMGRLADEHKLLLAGPFGPTRHDTALRGLFVLDTGNRGAAVEWASTDPTTQAGVFVLEYHDFSTDAPLAAMQQRNLDIRKKAEAEGKKLKPGDGARSYVLLTAENQSLARSELAPRMNGGGVLLLADLDGAHLFAILDAKDVADAKQRYGPMLDRIGACTLDDYFATDQLAHLRELKPGN